MLTELVILLNRIVGRIADFVLAPIAWLPGWLSITLIGVLTGITMLWSFKYTSNQRAIKRTRDRIQGNLLALSLFRDEFGVCLRCQGAILLDAARLLGHSLVPMLVMSLPLALLLGQLAPWYQSRPVKVGEEVVVTLQLAADAGTGGMEAKLMPSSSFDLVTGPVRVPSERMVCWNIAAQQAGRRELSFLVNGQTVTKELPVGAGFMPASLKRPSRSLVDLLLHPREQPFSADSPVQSIDVALPERQSWVCGAKTWLGCWFAISMIAALAARPFLELHI